MRLSASPSWPRQSGIGVGIIFFSSKATSPNCTLTSPIALGTIPPWRLAGARGQSPRRVDPPDLVRAYDVDKAHGRIEIRRIAVRSKPPAYLDKEWPGLVRVARIERTRETKVLCSLKWTPDLGPPVKV